MSAATPGQAVDRAHHLANSGLDEARRAIGMLRDFGPIGTHWVAITVPLCRDGQVTVSQILRSRGAGYASAYAVKCCAGAESGH